VLGAQSARNSRVCHAIWGANSVDDSAGDRESAGGEANIWADEIVIAAIASADGRPQAPVFLAEMKREGFPEFFEEAGAARHRDAGNVGWCSDRIGPRWMRWRRVLDAPAGGFAGTPFMRRNQRNRTAAVQGFLICADLTRSNIPGGRGARRPRA
jgi:hypothetical protein